jgi:hypothetical protein
MTFIALAAQHRETPADGNAMRSQPPACSATS